MRKLLLLPLLPLLFSFTMCGHRGAPKPPLSYKPQTPKVHGPIQEFTSPLIWWEKVERFDDGRKIPTPQKVSYKVVVNFGKRVVETEETYFKDSPIKPKERRCYSVVALYEGRESEKSEPVCINGKEPISEVPQVKRAVGGDGYAQIEFTPSPLYETEVFKNQTSEPFVKPYAVLKPGEGLFIDKKVKNGAQYTYLLRFSEGELKGAFSKEVRVVPQDRIPPLPPQDALLVKGEVCTLVWEPSPSEDVVAYKVVADGRELSTSGIYLTFKKCPKRVLIYAVDKAGNLSKPVVPEVVDEKGGSCNGEQVRPSGNGGLHQNP